MLRPLKEVSRGVFFHYLAFDYECAGIYAVSDKNLSPARWNELIGAFDVETLAKQIAECGFQYACLTIGQNSGYYLAPNMTYEKLVPRDNESRLARRDLIADLSAAMGKYGIPLIAYLPSGAPNKDLFACEKLDSGAVFRKNWEDVIREWSLRWGDKVAGWWFDGVHNPEDYRGDAPNFHTLAAAARAGNPNAMLAFNGGVTYPSMTLSDEEDFSAGEVNDPWKAIQSHVAYTKQTPQILTYSGMGWGIGPMRFSPGEMGAITHSFNRLGGPVTWDVPIERDGTLSPSIVSHLMEFKQIMNTQLTDFPLHDPEIIRPAVWSNIASECSFGQAELDGEKFSYPPENPCRILKRGNLERIYHLPAKRNIYGSFSAAAADYASIELNPTEAGIRFNVKMNDPQAECGHVRWDGSCFELRLLEDEEIMQYTFTPDGLVIPESKEFTFCKDDGGWAFSGLAERKKQIEIRLSVIRDGYAHSHFLFGGNSPSYATLSDL